MLHDSVRNQLYKDAIERCVSELTAAGDQSASVIDIGTGSGLLACFAASAGASSVEAIECNPQLARTARRVVADNCLDATVNVRLGHSLTARSCGTGWTLGSSMPPTVPRANLLTHELLDSGLLSEGLLSATRHACDVLLLRGAHVVPASIQLFAQPVQCAFFRHAFQLSEGAAQLLPPPLSAAACEGAAGYLELDVRPLIEMGRSLL